MHPYASMAPWHSIHRFHSHNTIQIRCVFFFSQEDAFRAPECPWRDGPWLHHQVYDALDMLSLCLLPSRMKMWSAACLETQWNTWYFLFNTSTHSEDCAYFGVLLALERHVQSVASGGNLEKTSLNKVMTIPENALQLEGKWTPKLSRGTKAGSAARILTIFPCCYRYLVSESKSALSTDLKILGGSFTDKTEDTDSTGLHVGLSVWAALRVQSCQVCRFSSGVVIPSW